MVIMTACEWCQENFEAHSFKARYCSNAHRTAASRARRKAAEAGAESSQDHDTVQEPSADPGSPITDATVAELRRAHLDGSPVGLVAVAIARRIDLYGAVESGAALASLGKAHAELLTKTLAVRSDEDGDRGDELARRREERRRGAGAG